MRTFDMDETGGKIYPAAVDENEKTCSIVEQVFSFVLAMYESRYIRNQFLFVFCGEGGVNRVFSVHYKIIEIQDGHRFKANTIFIVQQVVDGYMEEIGDMF